MRGVAASSRFELVAVADVDEGARQRAEDAFCGIRTFATHEEMFAACPTDVVCVATWPPSHLPITEAALDLPLTGIVVEKPLGDTAQAGRRIAELIKRRGLPVAVPHGLLVAEHSTEIMARVKNGEIGELKLVEIECCGWDIINAGIHWLNLFVMLTGLEPVRYVLANCDSRTRTYRDGMQVETNAVTYVETVSGVRAVMATGDYVTVSRDGKGTLFRLVGTAGMLEFWGWESAYRLTNAAHPEGTLLSVAAGARSNHQKHLENLAAQMDAGTPDYAVLESSLMALDLCEAAYVSSRHGCAVPMPLAEFEPPAPTDWDPGKPYGGDGGGRNGRELPPGGEPLW